MAVKNHLIHPLMYNTRRVGYTYGGDTKFSYRGMQDSMEHRFFRGGNTNFPQRKAKYSHGEDYIASRDRKTVFSRRGKHYFYERKIPLGW